MISTPRLLEILFENDEVKRNELIDELSAEDAKVLLKHCLNVMRGNMDM